MLFHAFWKEFYHAAMLIYFSWPIQGQDVTITSSLLTERDSSKFQNLDLRSEVEDTDINLSSSKLLEREAVTVISPSSASNELTNSRLISLKSSLLSVGEVPLPSESPVVTVPLDLETVSSVLTKPTTVSLNNVPSKSLDTYQLSFSSNVISVTKEGLEFSRDNYTRSLSVPNVTLGSSGEMSSSKSATKTLPLSSNKYTYVPNEEHTPHISLFVASSIIPSPEIYSAHHTEYATDTSLNPIGYNQSGNEVTNPHELEHKKLLMLVLRAEDCARISKNDFEKMLAKLIEKFGFSDVVPEVSTAKCYSHLNINLTVRGSAPVLQFLPNVDHKNDFTVDVLNRTFRIIKLEKIDLKMEKTKSNTSSTVITAIAKHESVAYIAVGVSFGLVLVICITVCCVKCCCYRKARKRYGAPKSSHVRLRPEDYTLTPIPRPTSLYVDYYRGSVTCDIYSTTSAGSIASTTPTVEQGVVQPFDTSIVPLEDSSGLPLENSRDPSVESVPVQSDLKTFNIQTIAIQGLRTASTESKEQLNPKQQTRRTEVKPSGVTNPTFQRY